MRALLGRFCRFVTSTLFEPSLNVTERLREREEPVDYTDALRYRGSARRGE